MCHTCAWLFVNIIQDIDCQRSRKSSDEGKRSSANHAALTADVNTAGACSFLLQTLRPDAETMARWSVTVLQKTSPGELPFQSNVGLIQPPMRGTVMVVLVFGTAKKVFCASVTEVTDFWRVKCYERN